MSFIDWNEKMMVNLSVIDNQHKKLIDLINALHDAMKAGKAKEILGKVLGEMIAYTDYHFSTEENLMRTHGFADFTKHKIIHDDLRKKALDLQKQHAAGVVTLSVDVSNFLKDWLKHHIGEMDKVLAAFLREKGLK